MVPSVAFAELAREYQQNVARYHSLNSLPISRNTVPEATLRSMSKKVPFPTGISGQKQAATSAHIGAIASGAAPSRNAAPMQPDPAALPEDHLDRPSARRSYVRQPLVVKSTIAPAGPNRPAAAAKSIQTKRSHPLATSGGRTSTPDRASAEQALRHIDRPRSERARIRTEAARPASARATRPAESAWPWIGLVLLLFGLTSIALAFASVGPGGAAAVGGIAARVRASPGPAGAIATRVRSKELSPRADGASSDRPAARGIRYRD
jgi:hypothetical protein